MGLLAIARPADALAVIARLRLRAPQYRYALASQAHVQMQLGQRDEAIVSLQALTEGVPGGPQAAACWFNLGFALAEAGRVEAAVPAFQTALTHDERLDRAWYGLGLALMRLGDFTQAVPALERNTVLQPLSPHGWYRLAQSWLALGEGDKAAKVLARLRSFEPRVAAQLEQENEVLRPHKAVTATQALSADGITKARHAAY